jgi:hypothetical protein
MKTITRRARPTTHFVKFTTPEVRRIEKAAKICGWKAGEGAGCARRLVLQNVAEILRSERKHERPA